MLFFYTENKIGSVNKVEDGIGKIYEALSTDLCKLDEPLAKIWPNIKIIYGNLISLEREVFSPSHVFQLMSTFTNYFFHQVNVLESLFIPEQDL